MAIMAATQTHLFLKIIWTNIQGHAAAIACFTTSLNRSSNRFIAYISDVFLQKTVFSSTFLDTER